MSKGTVGTGWSLVWRHKKIFVWVFVINLILGWLSILAPMTQIGKVLDGSTQSAKLSHGFDLGTFADLLTKPDITMPPLIQGSMLFSFLFFVFMLFVIGGILTAYREDRRLSTGEFFEASGAYFWRMVRILLLSIIPMIVVAVVAAILFGISSAIDNEKTAFEVRIVALVVTVVLVLLVRLWFDVAQVRAVAQNEYRMFRNVLRAFVISFRALGTLLWMYLRISIVAWVLLGLGLWLWTRLPGNGVGVSWLLLELLMLTQIFARLWQRAASVHWYGLYAEEHPAAVVEYTTPQPVEIIDSPATSLPPAVPLTPEAQAPPAESPATPTAPDEEPPAQPS